MMPNWKPCATARKKEKLQAGREARSRESENKKEARRRDGYRCRFPLCGCHRLKLSLEARLEVSHQTHKGAGGNPTGDRSTPDRLLTLCSHRHQHGAVSRHRGTLRARALTAAGMNGPVAWEAWDVAFRHGWAEIAREKAVQQLEELLPWQRRYLERLAEMDS
jgi:hypothetical protein